MIRDTIMQMASQDPAVAQSVDAMEAQLQRSPIVPEDLDEAIKLLEFVLQNPDKYAEMRNAAVKDGLIDEAMFPPEFDEVVIISILIAMYGLQDRLQQRGYSRGGLSVAGRRLQTGGRGGDSMLAHINPREAEVLRRMGGQGTVNPNTGLREYKGLKKILGTVLPIALSVFAPGVGTAISGFLGTALGLGTTSAGILGGALTSAASAKLTGGNVRQAAIMGGLGGGMSNGLGTKVGSTFVPKASPGVQNMIGNAVVGGASGQATGQGFLKGATQGALGQAVNQAVGSADLGSGRFQQGAQAGAQNFSNMLASGYDPKTAAIAGGLSGNSKGIRYTPPSPSDAVVNDLQNGTSQGQQNGTSQGPQNSTSQGQQNVKMPDGTMSPAPGTAGSNAQGQPGTYQLNPTTGQVAFVASPGNYVVNPTTGAIEWKVTEPSFFDKAMGRTAPTGSTAPATDGVLGNLGKVALTTAAIGALSGGSGLQEAPVQVQDAIKTLSPMQQEYFTRPSISWNWDKLQKDANQNNLSLNQFMARNWQQVASGAYNVQAQPQPQPTVQAAGGGALADIARFARGAGSGRADTIDAKLSDGEYVIDAETVAMLGDGSNQAGAQLLDQMRENVRTHKGKALARGKISPNAKSPLMYLKLKGVK